MTPEIEAAGDGWQPIQTATETAGEIEVRDRCGKVTVAHFAHSDGDGEQPAFGPAYFQKVRDAAGRVLLCTELHPQPIEWRPLPTPPEAKL